MRVRGLSFGLALLASACASTETTAPAGPPSLEIAPGLPAPPQARFYTDCVAQSTQAQTYDREANVLRFHCDGATAQRFYDGLAAWSAQQDSQIVDGARTWRFNVPIRENPSFVDFCWQDVSANAPAYACTVVLNVGDFLAQ